MRSIKPFLVGYKLSAVGLTRLICIRNPTNLLSKGYREPTPISGSDPMVHFVGFSSTILEYRTGGRANRMERRELNKSSPQAHFNYE